MRGIQFLRTFVVNLTNKGFFHTLSCVICYIYFKIIQYFSKRRFDCYDYEALEDPDKNSFFVPHFEWQIDTPQKERSAERSDDAFCFGVNSKSEALAIHISRKGNDQVHCSFLLQLSDGRVFCLPKEHVLQQETTEEYTFGSSRIKLQCLLPMRKWRIFFNGLLREHRQHDDDDDNANYKHVKVTFLCTSSSEVFDFESDMSKSFLSQLASDTMDWSFKPQAFMHWVKNAFNNYEQPVMLLGTVNIDDEPEREMYLWGTRGRYMGKVQVFKEFNFQQIYGNFENGAVIHLEIINFISWKFISGYLMRSDGFIHPIEELSSKVTEDRDIQMHFNFISSGVNYSFSIKNLDFRNLLFKKEYCCTSLIHFTEMILNGKKGRGFVIKGNSEDNIINRVTVPKIKFISDTETSLCIPFNDPRCQESRLTGGKGSSLAILHSMTEDQNFVCKFIVPHGMVITTEAYRMFIKGKLESELKEFEKIIWASSENNIKELCEIIVEKVCATELPEHLITSITAFLDSMKIGEGIKFAIRSSAIGEDTEQMSAAGQMETFLGLCSLDDILNSLKKCWASQFAFQAVHYKRHYGQRINTPMAVVIQEMVACEVAGVAFTCDPVTGDPSFISITANYGLGESVVSAAAEPDTITFKKDINNTISFHNEQIGKKQSKIVMSGDSGTKEIEIHDSQSVDCCLSQQLALELANFVVSIEEKFGSSRDLEWGVVENKIFLFQARPVTSLDVDTEFESKHFSDVYLRNEKECLTTGNVGEVMPGALSVISLDFFAKIFDLSATRRFYNKHMIDAIPDVPYYPKKVIYSQNHAFFSLIDSLLRTKHTDANLAKGMTVAVFGEMDVNKETMEIAEERHNVPGKSYKTNSYFLHIFLGIALMSYLFRKLFRSEPEKFQISCPQGLSSSEILNQIGNQIHKAAKAMYLHMRSTISSSIWNTFLLATLAQCEGDWNANVYSDFAYMLSTCSDVESADVPQAIQNLACVIAKNIDPQKFANMTFEEALKWLKNSESEAGKSFQHFLMKHGHRCLKEFDLRSETWGTNPQPLLKTLQDLVSSNVKETNEKETPSFKDVIANMKVKITSWAMLKLRVFVPMCRQCVRNREASKSMYIEVTQQMRQVVNQLANSLILEGYIPNKDLIYFLCIDEIRQLVKTRSPRLVARAMKRQKVHNNLEKLLFPELTIGIPKPVNPLESIDTSAKGFTMKGVPVSQGIAKATACVVTKLEDAVNIQPGDILIAHSTDIGWSPYFPLLSGVVTELGGLISHGAVVAREYGLPCVVGLYGATRAFKSGDCVLLDGNKGTLTRLDVE